MSVVTEFTPLQSAIGGALIGVSAVLLMLGSGRIAGISGILARLVAPRAGSQPVDALAFVAGLIAAPLVWTHFSGAPVTQTVTDNVVLLISAGLLVGFGAVYGGGCTSGHGVCGLSRFSIRSLVAVATFMATAAITVFIVRHVLGAA